MELSVKENMRAEHFCCFFPSCAWMDGRKDVFFFPSYTIMVYGPLLKTVRGLDKTLTLSQAEREEVSQCILGTKGFFKDLLLGRYSTIILTSIVPYAVRTSV